MNNRWLFYCLGILMGLTMLVFIQMPSEKAKMVTCDVGQGDAILLIKGSNQVLIDGGPSSEKILKCLSRHVPFWDRTIELIVMTNTDFDHMNGLSTVLLRYSNTAFVTGDGVHESEALERFRAALTESGTKIGMVEAGEVIRVGESQQLKLQVLWPAKVNREYLAVFGDQIEEPTRSQILGASAKREDLNERSVVILWEEGGYKILLTGDTGFQAEKELLETGRLPDVDILKVGHHGSKYASSLEFLDKIRPEMAIISVGERNRYGHPTEETIGRLEEVKAVIRRTDQEGDVIVELP